MNLQVARVEELLPFPFGSSSTENTHSNSAENNTFLPARQILAQTFADPVKRFDNRFAPTNLPLPLKHLLDPDGTKIHQYMTMLITESVAFRDYLDLDRLSSCDGAQLGQSRWSCSSKDPCIGDLSNAKNLLQLSEKFSKQMLNHLQTDVTGLRSQNNNNNNNNSNHVDVDFLCASCGCQLIQFDSTALAHEQHLQTFRFKWQNARCCHVPRNVHQLICQGCYIIWQMCNYDEVKFNKVRCTIFRICATSPVHESDLLVYARRIDQLKRKPVDASSFGDLDTLRSVWCLQEGLVAYPIPGSWKIPLAHKAHNMTNMVQRTRSILAKSVTTTLPTTNPKRQEQNNSHPYESVQAKWERMEDEEAKYQENNSVQQQQQQQQQHNSFQFKTKHGLKIKEEVLPDHAEQKKKKAEQMEQKESKHAQNQAKRQRRFYSQLQQLNSEISVLRHLPSHFIVFWIPLDPNLSSHSPYAIRPTARDRRFPLDSGNYLLTNALFRHLEDLFGYRELFHWMYNVCFWNMDNPQLPLKDFADARFRFYAFNQQTSLAAKLEHMKMQHQFVLNVESRPVKTRNAAQLQVSSSTPTTAQIHQQAKSKSRSFVTPVAFENIELRPEPDESLIEQFQLSNFNIPEVSSMSSIEVQRFLWLILNKLRLEKHITDEMFRYNQIHNTELAPIVLDSETGQNKERQWKQIKQNIEQELEGVVTRLRTHEKDEMFLDQVAQLHAVNVVRQDNRLRRFDEWATHQQVDFLKSKLAQSQNISADSNSLGRLANCLSQLKKNPKLRSLTNEFRDPPTFSDSVHVFHQRLLEYSTSNPSLAKRKILNPKIKNRQNQDKKPRGPDIKPQKDDGSVDWLDQI